MATPCTAGKRPSILVLLGIDGAGKSTAAQAIAALLGPATPVLVLNNYSGRKTIAAWQERRGIRLPVRAVDAVETTVRVLNVLVNHAKAARFDGLVVMDRHLHCQLALRKARGLGANRLVSALLRILPPPDAVAYFDLAPEQAHHRIVRRGTDRETLQDLRAYSRGYRDLAAFPSFTRVDAGGSILHLMEQLEGVVDGLQAAG